ncbi:hypothetical protein FR943_06820 [Mycobacterium sp. TNTM28]|uniref:Uncharacterized protein n=1 Tax=[Mycobacterium] fortunisiensis TaxID=2600579 RepID=A0ABS6KJ60_9MYCO|nr:hypothetical protein [[Mycobacterium] fortunisiensis]MBU9763553.1 hypothetical protein [[Mycobacterium] fortunisiensis]
MAGRDDISPILERRLGQRVTLRRVGRPVDLPNPAEALARSPSPVTVLRTADMLLVRFSFQNLHRVQVDGTLALARRDDARPAFLIADFPPQHLVEQAFSEQGPADLVASPEPPYGFEFTDEAKATPPNKEVTPLAPPVLASLSAHSRLAFMVADETIAWSLDGLLAAMSRLPLSVAPHAENPLRILIPIGEQIADAITTARVQQVLLTNQAQAVPSVIGAVGRSAATARVLDHRLGKQISARVTATSRLAVDLGISAQITARPTVLLRPPAPRAPTSTETAIELPWRLQLSPHHGGGFAHTEAPVEHDGRIELWHSRLGVRTTTDADGICIDEENSEDRTVRAIWARDIDHPPHDGNWDVMGGSDDPSFTKSLTSRDRRMLVHETSDFTLKSKRRPWDPPAVDVDLLMLSALGGWLRSEFSTDTLPNGDFSITEWKHRAAMGRDHEVKVVYAGFLYPFGHPASLVKVTERKIQPNAPLPGRYAYLRQRFFIVVRQQTMTYPEGEKTWRDPNDPDNNEIRLDLAMPFSSVSILTRITPDLNDPEQEGGLTGAFCFFPTANNTPFPFKILATDRENQIVEYGGPLLFVGRERNVDEASLAAVRAAYLSADPAKRIHHLGGQRVAFAAATDPTSGASLDTTLSVDTLEFDAALITKVAVEKQDQAQFWPMLSSAGVVVPAMNALAGAAEPVLMKQPAHYRENGFADNHTHVFLEVVKPKDAAAVMSFAQQADRSGGFVTPSLAVTGLSGSKGPIGGLIAEAVSGSMTPENFFGGLEIPGKLFGAVELSDLLADIGLTPENMPSFIAKSVNQVTGFLDDLARISAVATDLQNRYAAEADAGLQGLLTALADTGNQAQAVLTAFAKISTLDDAQSAIQLLRTDLGELNSTIDGASALPNTVRVQLTGIIQRLGEYVGPGSDIIEAASQLMNGMSLPETVHAKLTWSTQLAPWPQDAPLFQPRPKAGETDLAARATLDLCVEVQAATKPGIKPSVTTTCSISPFKLQLLGGEDSFIALNIDVIEFTATPGRKTDVHIELAKPGVEFGGPLSFVNVLRSLIPLNGFSDPPYLDVDAQGITAGFDLALPDIPLGVMSLSNVSLAAQANIPFIGDSLDFSFGFCTRENPFRLTVWLFGGGGFFGITVAPQQCRMLEAAFEFGAAAALDFGVASGTVDCMAGIYFKLQTTAAGDDSQLTGYFRLHGEVDVLGLISVSIELYLELNYDFDTNTATGRATLTVEVEVAMLSKSVEITCEKKFKGSDRDPSFREMLGVPSADGTRAWDEYCDAFCPI